MSQLSQPGGHLGTNNYFLFDLPAGVFFRFVTLVRTTALAACGKLKVEDSSAMAKYQWRRSSCSGLPSFSQIKYAAILIELSPIGIELCLAALVRLFFTAI
jgi:hypothetical protein